MQRNQNNSYAVYKGFCRFSCFWALLAEFVKFKLERTNFNLSSNSWLEFKFKLDRYTSLYFMKESQKQEFVSLEPSTECFRENPQRLDTMIMRGKVKCAMWWLSTSELRSIHLKEVTDFHLILNFLRNVEGSASEKSQWLIGKWICT